MDVVVLERFRRGGKNRKTLRDIPYYPSPQQFYKMLMEAKGWPYKTNMEYYRKRDRALAALLYLAGLRISEALRLTKKQFEVKRDYILIKAIKLSKSRVKGKPRRIQYRDARLPLKGERKKLTQIIMEYLKACKEDRLFPFTPQRAWQIIKSLLPEYTCHWLRAFCEDYLYTKWDRDLLAVADYIKVDPRTLQEYIRKRHERYPAV